MNNFTHTLAFVIFPYFTIFLFIFGHAYRYVTDWRDWNAKSSQLLDKNSLKYGITLFHWGILVVLIGHAGGMLIPQWTYDIFGIDTHAHEFIAYWAGVISGILLVIGVTWLLVRRIVRERLAATTSVNDYVLLAFILAVGGIGMYNVLFTRYDILFKIAPWIRSIVILSPRPELILDAPPALKLHILLGLALLAFSPFTRLVHIWSIPVSYAYRSYVVFRRRTV